MLRICLTQHCSRSGQNAACIKLTLIWACFELLEDKVELKKAEAKAPESSNFTFPQLADEFEKYFHEAEKEYENSGPEHSRWSSPEAYEIGRSTGRMHAFETCAVMLHKAMEIHYW